MRGDSLQREIMDGRMEEKRKVYTKAHGLDDGERIREIQKEKAQQWEEWSRWTFGCAGRQIT